MFGKLLKIFTWSNEGFGYRIFTFKFMAQTAYWTLHKKTMVLHFHWEFLHHIGWKSKSQDLHLLFLKVTSVVFPLKWLSLKHFHLVLSLKNFKRYAPLSISYIWRFSCIVILNHFFSLIQTKNLQYSWAFIIRFFTLSIFITFNWWGLEMGFLQGRFPPWFNET